MAGNLREVKNKTKQNNCMGKDAITSAHLCTPRAGASIKKLVFHIYGWEQTLPAAYAEQAGKIGPSDLCCPNQTECNA